MTKVDTRKIVLVILFISILLVVALIVGKVTYSYLAPTIDEDIVMNGEVTATGDTISFTSGTALSLSATTDNFTTGGANLTSSTNPKAKLVASTKTNNATSSYYVGVYIKSNTYKYSTSNSTPEIILTIKDENGNNVTSVSGLTYVTQSGVSGFDVTTKTGLFDIKTDYPISTTSSTIGTTHTWTFTLTFVNLSTDQSVNENGKMDMEVYLQKKPFPTTIGDVCSNGDNLATCVKNLYDNSISPVSNLYHHNASLTNGAGDNSYRYAGSSATTNNYVCFGSDAETCPNDNLYRIIGVFDGRVRLIKADYATSALLGTDTSDYGGTYSESALYYQGDSSNLTNIAGYYWNKANYDTSKTATGYYNDWSYSELNKTHLNKNYLENIGSTWSNMIDTTTWKVGGFADTAVVPSTLYTNEITSPSTQVTSTYSDKIGLMYVSDYAFAAAPSAWTTTPYNYKRNDASGNKITDENWMYMGLWEWTMARSSYSPYAAGSVLYSGYVEIRYSYTVRYAALGVRPVFHLTSKVEVLEGDGTLGSPLKISAGA